jgi:O-antigen/teichoic acid export membrane protein
MINPVKKTVVKNFSILLVGQIISMIFSTAFVIICARYLGDVRFGKYAFASSFALMFSSLGALNLQTKAARDVAQDRSRTMKYLSNLMPLTVILGVVVFVLSVAVLLMMRRPSDLTVFTLIFSGVIVFQIMTAGLRWWFQAYQKLEYDALLVGLLSPLKLCLALVVFVLGGGLVPLAMIIVGANFLILVLAYYVTKRKFSHIRWELDLRFWREFIVKNIPFSLSIIFAAIFGNIDRILLSLMKGDAITGWYSAAFQAVTPMKVIPAVFSMAILPVFAERYVLHKEEFNRLIEKSLRYMLIIVFPLAIAISLLAEKIMLLLFGSEFMNGATALSILAWAAGATFINTTVGKAIIGAGQEKLNALFCGIGLAINLFLNFLLIPSLAHVGASISILVAESTISLLVLTWVYKRKALNIEMLYSLIKPGFAAVGMGICIYLLRSHNLWLLIPLGTVVYFSCLFLLKVFNTEEKDLMKRLFFQTPFRIFSGAKS